MQNRRRQTWPTCWKMQTDSNSIEKSPRSEKCWSYDDFGRRCLQHPLFNLIHAQKCQYVSNLLSPNWPKVMRIDEPLACFQGAQHVSGLNEAMPSGLPHRCDGSCKVHVESLWFDMTWWVSRSWMFGQFWSCSGNPRKTRSSRKRKSGRGPQAKAQ